jgi:hypothetical protein
MNNITCTLILYMIFLGQGEYWPVVEYLLLRILNDTAR